MATCNNLGLRGRIMAGVLLMTSAASFTSLLGATATANAAPDDYIALAVGDVNDAPPVKTSGGISIGPDATQAKVVAMSNCEAYGGRHCVLEILAQNTCAAAVANDYGEIEAASDTTFRRAEENAMGKLQSPQGAHVVVSGCTNGQAQLPPPPNQPPPPNKPEPKLGPTVSFSPILGGLKAHITDRSGVASQCTYVMDDINRTFGLAANSTFDLRIVPAIPRFHDRDVTITCDNGTKTQVTTRF